jgi:hypothetical protein
VLEGRSEVLSQQRQQRDVGGCRLRAALPRSVEHDPQPGADRCVDGDEGAPWPIEPCDRRVGEGRRRPPLEIRDLLLRAAVDVRMDDLGRQELGVVGGEHGALPGGVPGDGPHGSEERAHDPLGLLVDRDGHRLSRHRADLAIALLERGSDLAERRAGYRFLAGLATLGQCHERAHVVGDPARVDDGESRSPDDRAGKDGERNDGGIGLGKEGLREDRRADEQHDRWEHPEQEPHEGAEPEAGPGHLRRAMLPGRPTRGGSRCRVR